MKLQSSQERVPKNVWITLEVLLLGISLAVVSQSLRSIQPNPFPSFKDQIAEGMTIEEVKAILGEPEEVEQLAKLVKVPIAYTHRDADGQYSYDHVVSARYHQELTGFHEPPEDSLARLSKNTMAIGGRP